MNSKLYIIIWTYTFSMISITCGAQNVGIGTINSSRAKLEVHGLAGNTAAIFGGDGAGMGLIASWPEIGFNAYFNAGVRYIGNGHCMIQLLDPGAGYMGFDIYASGTKDALATIGKRAMAIANNGRVGIGQSPGFDATLSVSRDPGFDCTAYFNAQQFSAFNYTSSEYTVIRGGATGSPVFFNYYAENSKVAIGSGASYVGINWATPVYPLEIHHPEFALALKREGSNGNWIVSVKGSPILPNLNLYFRPTADNTIFQRGSFSYITGQYSPISDYRTKQNIQPLPGMLEKLMRLEPVGYEMKYNNPGHDKTIGFMAQDVQEIFPGLVHIRADAMKGYKNISDLHLLDYSGLAPVVIKALQEQHHMLVEMKQRVAALE